MSTTSEFCFYCPRSLCIIDHAILQGEEYRSAFSKRSLLEIDREYPGAIVCTWEEAEVHQSNGYKSPPKEITEKEWHYFLGCLPPVGWLGRPGRQSFKMSERLCGNITSIFAEVDGRYFQMHNTIFLPHEEIIAKVKTFEEGNRC